MNNDINNDVNKHSELEECIGYSFFTEQNNSIKVICINNSNVRLLDWIGISPEKVFIFWGKEIYDFFLYLKSSGLYNFNYSDFRGIPLYSLKVRKYIDVEDNNRIKIEII